MSQDRDARLRWSRTTLVMAVVFAFGGGCGGKETASDLTSDHSLSDVPSDALSDAGADGSDGVSPELVAGDSTTDLDGAAGDLDIPHIPSCRYSQMGPVGSVVALCHEGDSPVMPFPSDFFTRPATPPSSGNRLWVGLGRNQLTDDAQLPDVCVADVGPAGASGWILRSYADSGSLLCSAGTLCGQR